MTIRPTAERIELESRIVWVKSEANDQGLAEFGGEFTEARQEIQKKLKGFSPRYFNPEV